MTAERPVRDSGPADGEGQPPSSATAAPAAGGRRRGGSAAAALREVVIVVGSALVLSLLVKTFLVQAFYIPSPSMEQTLQRGDRVVVSKLTPGPFEVQRGDVLVFRDPGGWLDASSGGSPSAASQALRDVLTFVGLLPSDAGEHLIKRVIGLPGDVVACCDEQGRVTVNGEALDEPYLYPGDVPSQQPFEVSVPEGQLWMMGDHRSASADSRAHLGDPGGGTVPLDAVVGRAFSLVWPLDRMTGIGHPTDVFADVPDAP